MCTKVVGQALVVALAIGLAATPGSARQLPAGRTLVLGRVSDSPDRDHAGLAPIVRYAASRLSDLGVVRGEVLFARDNTEMAALLRSGKVDWVTEGPASAAVFVRDASAVPLVRRWKGGVAVYRTVILARQGGPSNLAELRGRRLAFEDPGSTTGCLAPRALISAAGLRMVSLAAPDAPVPGDAVGTVFAGSELNVAAWTHRGIVDAGATSDLAWTTDETVPRSVKARLRVIHEGPPMPRTLELVGPRLPAALRERLREVLVGAGDDPAARDALAAYGGTTRFDAVPPGTLEALAHLLPGGRR